MKANAPPPPSSSSSAISKRVQLVQHPARVCTIDLEVSVLLEAESQGDVHLIRLTYGVVGETDKLRLPGVAEPIHADELWKHTCFEAFVGSAASGEYEEFNFAPSTQWAHYRFASERVLAANQPSRQLYPSMNLSCTPSKLLLSVAFSSPRNLTNWDAWGLTAVIELKDGSMSYWALNHPAPLPDFHHPAGRALSWQTHATQP